MTVAEICKKLELEVLSGNELLDRKVSNGICCDLLSRVMAVGKKDSLWITVQTHINIVAIAVLLEFSCIIVPESIDVDSKTISKAEDEGIVILSSRLGAFELTGRLYQLGIRGV